MKDEKPSWKCFVFLSLISWYGLLCFFIESIRPTFLNGILEDLPWWGWGIVIPVGMAITIKFAFVFFICLALSEQIIKQYPRWILWLGWGPIAASFLMWIVVGQN
tara:strand:+ start:495 stop:809 length:315 start_codon:yes stop_codon:yes gene_type:complete